MNRDNSNIPTGCNREGRLIDMSHELYLARYSQSAASEMKGNTHTLSCGVGMAAVCETEGCSVVSQMCDRNLTETYTSDNVCLSANSRSNLCSLADKHIFIYWDSKFPSVTTY